MNGRPGDSKSNIQSRSELEQNQICPKSFVAKQRDPVLDVLKGIAIILIVWGHVGLAWTPLIYTFHVPLFFIVSGFLHNDEDRIAPFVKKKIRVLWLPFVVFSASFWLMRNCIPGLASMLSPLQPIGSKPPVVQLIAILSLNETEEILGALWFVSALFFASVSYKILKNFALSKYKRYANEIIILALITVIQLWNKGHFGALDAKYGNLKLGAALVALAFYSIGTEIKIRAPKFRLHSWALAAACVLLLSATSGPCHVDVRMGIYPSLLFLVSASLLGFWICLSISALITRNGRFCNILTLLGKESFMIMALHIFSFKLVTLLFCYLTDKNYSLLNQFGVVDAQFFGSPLFAKILYLTVGILVPLIFALIIQTFKKAVS